MGKFKNVLIRKYKILLFCVLPVLLLGCGEDDAMANMEIYFQINEILGYIEKTIITLKDNTLTISGRDADVNKFSIINKSMSKINVLAIDPDYRDFWGVFFLLSIFNNENANQEIIEKFDDIISQIFDKSEEEESELGASKNKRLSPLRVRFNFVLSFPQVTSVNFEVGNKKYPFKKTNESDVWIIDLASVLQNKDVQAYALRVFKSLDFTNMTTEQFIKKLNNLDPLEFDIPMSYINISYIR